MTLVKIIGRVRSDMAFFGSIASTKNAIAAAGNPIPKKPFMMPANKKIAITEMVIEIFCDGKIYPLMKSINRLSTNASRWALG